MHLSPVLTDDAASIVRSGSEPEHRATLVRGLTVIVVLGGLLLLALAPRYVRAPSMVSALADYPPGTPPITGASGRDSALCRSDCRRCAGT